MKTKLSKVRKQTERDLKALDDAVEKHALAIAYRFGDLDGSIDRTCSELLEYTRRWISELREYIDEREADGEKWEL